METSVSKCSNNLSLSKYIANLRNDKKMQKKCFLYIIAYQKIMKNFEWPYWQNYFLQNVKKMFKIAFEYNVISYQENSSKKFSDILQYWFFLLI